MPLTAKVKERIDLSPDEFPQVAVNAMIGLQYRSELFDEAFSQLVFYDDAVESYGSDSWRCRYQAILSWIEKTKGIELEVKVKEKNYGDTHIDTCIRRAQRIMEEVSRMAEVARHKRVIDVPWRSKFATAEDLNEGGFLFEPGSTPEQRAQGLLIGKFQDKKLWLPKNLKHRHVLVCGPTGCGKSTSVFIPNLIERVDTSAIVTEASAGSKLPVLYGETAGWRAKCGQRIIYFNPDDENTMRINPVDLVKSIDDAQMIANLIVANTTSESHMGDQVWSQAETHLLQALLLHVAGSREDIDAESKVGDGANLGALRKLLRKGPIAIAKEMESTNQPEAWAEFSAFLNNSSENFRFGVVSGLLARLSLFANPKICAATEVTDFSLQQLAQERFTFYLSVPVHRTDYLPLSALAFNFAFTFILANLERLKHPLTLYLDEFTNFGAIPGIGRYLTVIRNAGIGAVLGVQDLAQLEYLYKDKMAQILWSQPRTKILFPPADDRMADRISRMLGNETQQEAVSASGQLSSRQFPRPLIDGAELMRLEKDGDYLIVSNTNPIKAGRIRSWLDYPNTTRLPVPKYSPPSSPSYPNESQVSPDIHVEESLGREAEEEQPMNAPRTGLESESTPPEEEEGESNFWNDLRNAGFD